MVEALQLVVLAAELRHPAALHHQRRHLTLPRKADAVGAKQAPGLGFIAGLHALDHGIRKLISRSAFDTHATDGADPNIAARGNLLRPLLDFNPESSFTMQARLAGEGGRYQRHEPELDFLPDHQNLPLKTFRPKTLIER